MTVACAFTPLLPDICVVVSPGKSLFFLFFEKTRLFAQLELGMDLIFHEKHTIPAFLGGLAVGWRIPLGDWYLGPEIREGYPYIWGLAFGRRICSCLRP
jgi:hypothetical protein